MTFSASFQHPSPTGATLNVYRHDAEGKPRGTIQINHGMAEHAARYARFAETMAAQGFNVYAHDHRGHGHTTAPDAPLGHFGMEPAGEAVLRDVDAIHALIGRDHPGLPVILFGHSMGGLIALNSLFAHSDRVCAAAIWNANFSAGLAGQVGKAILAWERFRLGSDIPSRLLPKLTFQSWGRQVKNAKTAFDWLSHDDTEVARYVVDPLCGFDVSVATWRAVFEFISRGADDASFGGIRRDLPINLAGGEMDPATDGGKTVEKLAGRMSAMGFSNLQATLYPRTRHESLNELNRNMIVNAFSDWAKRVVA